MKPIFHQLRATSHQHAPESGKKRMPRCSRILTVLLSSRRPVPRTRYCKDGVVAFNFASGQSTTRRTLHDAQERAKKMTEKCRISSSSEKSSRSRYCWRLQAQGIPTPCLISIDFVREISLIDRRMASLHLISRSFCNFLRQFCLFELIKLFVPFSFVRVTAVEQCHIFWL